MNFLDLLILLPIGYAIYKGFKNGLIIEVFTLLAVLVGIYAGVHFSDGMTHFLQENWGWEGEYVPVLAFIITFLLVGAMVYFAGKMLEKVVDVVHLSLLNKLLGIFFAVVKSIYIVSILLVLVEGIDERKELLTEQVKDDSFLYHPIKEVSLQTIPRMQESALFIGSRFQNEREETGMTVEQILRAKEIADSLGIDANDAKMLLELHQKYEVND